MEFNGNLSLLGLANIIQILCSGGKSGILEITHDEHTGEIFFANGNIVYAKASFRIMRLGEILESKGFLSAKDIDTILEYQKHSKGLFGELFVEKGFGSKEDLVSSLFIQTEEIIFEILHWEEGFFDFREDAPLSPEIQQILDLLPHMVSKNQQKIQTLLKLRNRLPSKDMLLQCTVDMMQKVEGIVLTDIEWDILSLVDGRNSIDDICRTSNISPFVASKIIYDLMSYGMLEHIPRDAELPDVDEFTRVVASVYMEVHYELFKRFHEILGDQAWVLFARSFNDIKAQNIEVFSDIFFEADATLNEETVFQNLRKVVDSSRFLFMKNAFNNLIVGELLLIKNALGNDFYDIIVRETKALITERKNLYDETVHASLTDLELIIDLVTPVATDYEKGKELFDDKQFHEAKEKLIKVPKSNPFYAQTQAILKKIDEELKDEDKKAAEEALDDTARLEQSKIAQFKDLYNRVEHLLGEMQFQTAYNDLKKLKELNPGADEVADLQDVLNEQVYEEIKYRLGAKDDILVFTSIFNPEDVKYFNLSPEEAYIISRIDGSNDIKTVIQMSGLPALEAYFILLEIHKSGLVTTKRKLEEQQVLEQQKAEQEKIRAEEKIEKEREEPAAAHEDEYEPEYAEDEEDEEEEESGESMTGAHKTKAKSMFERLGKVRRRPVRTKKKKKVRKVSDKDRIMRVLKFQQFIKNKGPHEILRVSLDAEPAELKSAYRKLVAEFHPDLYRSEVYEGIQNNVSAVFEAVSDAYQRLSGQDAAPVLYSKPAAKTDTDKASLADRKVTAHKHYQEGMQAYNRRDFEAAIGQFERAIANYSNNPVYFSMLNDARMQARLGNAYSVYNEGLKYYDKGDVNTAIRHIKNAIKMDPTKPVFYSKVAEIIFKNSERYPEAERYARRALELDAENSEYYVILGQILKIQRKLDEARQEFKLALKWDKNNLKAKSELDSLR